MKIFKRWYIIAVFILVLGEVIWQGFPALQSYYAHAHGSNTAASNSIKHVVIVMMENHTFDNLFGQFPGVNGMSMPAAPNPLQSDFDHSPAAYAAAMDGGKMDEFPSRGYIQYSQSDIPNYWTYAQQFGLSDNFFSSMATNSAPNHLAMIAAQTGGLYGSSLMSGCKSTQNTR